MNNHKNNHKNNRKRRKWLYFGGGGLALVIALIAALGLRSNHKINPSKLAKVQKGDIARSVVATGRIEPLAKVQVKSKASGIVKEIYVHYGDHVRRGQVLVELDKEDLAARLREARASLLAAQAAQQATEAAYERNQVEAQAPDLPYLKSSTDRAQELYNDALIAKAVLEDSEKAYHLALNRQMAALQNVAVTRAELARAKAQVAQAQAALERAEEDLRNSTIGSPLDALVLSRDVEVGDAVSSILVLGSQATLVMTLGDVSEVYVLGKVDEADIGKVYLGQRARIRVESFPEKAFEGQVTKISPMGVVKDNVTTFEVRVSIQNPSGELKANMSANAEIILEEKKNVLLVPETAVIYDKASHTAVEIPDPRGENGRRRLGVKFGISNGVKTEVLEGLREGQEVILQ